MACTKLLAVLCVIPLVRGAGIQDLEFYINGKGLESPENVANYTYEYRLHELVTFKCICNLDGYVAQLDLDPAFDYIEYTEPCKDVTMQIIMKPEYHMRYISCQANYLDYDEDDRDLDDGRVNLIFKSDEEPNTIRINGLMVKPDGDGLVRYFYYGDRPTDVTCNGKALSPSMVRAQFGDRADAEVVCDMPGQQTKIKLIKGVPNNGLDISGLSDKRILFHESRSNVSRSIRYEYTDGDDINTKCTDIRSGNEITWRPKFTHRSDDGSWNNMTKRDDMIVLACIHSIDRLSDAYVNFKYVANGHASKYESNTTVTAVSNDYNTTDDNVNTENIFETGNKTKEGSGRLKSELEAGEKCGTINIPNDQKLHELRMQREEIIIEREKNMLQHENELFNLQNKKLTLEIERIQNITAKK